MDVRATCRGIDQRAVKRLTGMEIHLLDGNTNEEGYAPLLELIDEAEDSIFVESPYVTYPFLDRLVDARRRGVAVTLVQPQGNNYPAVAAYVARTASRADLGLRLLPGMIHLKVLLIDDRVLVMGSSNFDIVSYRAEQEIVVLMTDAAAIREVKQRVLEPDLEASQPADRSGRRLGESSLLTAAAGCRGVVAGGGEVAEGEIGVIRRPAFGSTFQLEVTPPVLSGAGATLSSFGENVCGGAGCERRFRSGDKERRPAIDRGRSRRPGALFHLASSWASRSCWRPRSWPCLAGAHSRWPPALPPRRLLSPQAMTPAAVRGSLRRSRAQKGCGSR